MSNQVNSLALQHVNDSVTRQFMLGLSQFVIVDIGTISNVYHDGTVDIRTSRIVGNKVITYTHVELLAPGSSMGTFSSVPTAGSTCLVFSPRTSIPNTKDMKVGMNQPYSIVGMKALMVSAPLPTMVRAGYDCNGNFILQGTNGGALMCVEKDGDLVFTAGPLHVYMKPAGVVSMEWAQRVVNISETGVQTEDWYNADGFITRKEVNDPVNGSTTITVYDGTKDKKVLHSDTTNLDGSSQTQVTDADGNVLFDMVISPEGQYDMTVGKDPGVTIQITPEGAISISAKAAVGLTCEDAVSIEAQQDVTVKGANVTVEAQQACTVKGTASVEVNAPQVKITGGQLTVNGNAAPSGSGPFCGIPACLFTGAPHVGSMVAGT